jgi:GH24 family phage-related lysozyme (muramidase)
MMDLATQLLDEEEGPPSPTVYTDSEGYATIARGCLVDKRVKGAGLCAAAMAVQTAHDEALARGIASTFPHFTELNDVRQAVLVSMCYQMGTKPMRWPNFMVALTSRDYDAAAAAGLETDWARSETPKRAEREMGMLRSGVWIAQS